MSRETETFCWRRSFSFPVFRSFTYMVFASFLFSSLKSWDMHCINVGFANGAEIDLKIMEDFKESDLVDFLRNYADLKGIGGNILTGDSC